MAWHSFEIGMQLRQGRGCVGSSCAQVYYKSGAFAVAGNSRVHLGMGERFRVALKGRTRQQLSELWFRQSVCWRQLTAAAKAASSLTRIRRVAVRFWRQATCICHPLEQFFNRRGSRNRLRARGPRSQGHVPHKFGMHPAQTNGLPLPAQLLDQPRVHLHRLLQLLDCDPLADRVGLVDAAGAEHQRVHIVLIALGFGAVRDGDRARRAGRAGSRRWIRRMGICGIRMGVVCEG